MNTKSITLTLPHEITSCLSRAEIFTADLILDLCRCTSRKVKSKALYTCVSQDWLAKRVGVSREWISKCTVKLSGLGIIDSRRRRKTGEKWNTNIYRVGEALKKGYHTAKQLFLNYLCRVNLGAHKVSKNKESKKNYKVKSLLTMEKTGMSFDNIMAKCLQRIETFDG